MITPLVRCRRFSGLEGYFRGLYVPSLAIRHSESNRERNMTCPQFISRCQTVRFITSQGSKQVKSKARKGRFSHEKGRLSQMCGVNADGQRQHHHSLRRAI